MIMNILEKIQNIFNLCDIEISDKVSKIIMFNVDKEKQAILNYINREVMPNELEYVWLTRSLGATLKFLSTTGLLKSDNFKLEPMLASMTRGDVSMSFKALSREEQINTLISSFENYGENQLQSFRVIKWM